MKTPGLRLAVVSWATNPLSPRGQRTTHVAKALERYGRTERVGPQVQATRRSVDGMPHVMRRVIGRILVPRIFLDSSEISAGWQLQRWHPDLDAAVLVGFPFAPLLYAAKCLRRRGIPYVVDVGDPWAIGQSDGPFRSQRALRAERYVWQGAAGAVVTTDGQAAILADGFPHLKILVRPNGFEQVAATATAKARRMAANGREELRLVHYGSLYGPRLNPAPFLEHLSSSQNWQRVVLRQHGDDWNGTTKRLERYVDVELRPALPWDTVLREAGQFDAALAIGNDNPAQLPSKAVHYLTLPIPRIALVNDESDALASYVRDKPGWATMQADEDVAAARVAELVSKRWTPAELSPPLTESWTSVETLLGDFVIEATGLRPIVASSTVAGAGR